VDTAAPDLLVFCPSIEARAVWPKGSIRLPIAQCLKRQAIAPDINVQVAASRSDHPHHSTAREWLEQALAECEAGGSLEILAMVAAGFLRLVTNSRVFPDPSPIKDAVAFLDALLATPGVEMPERGREWQTFRRMCLDEKLRGNDIPDAWIAAAVKVLNGRLVTFDRGFARLLGRSEVLILK
jgi:toxin-antitoxin system PIN domain toxin